MRPSKKLLPTAVTNEYRGSRIALYAFAVLTVVTVARSLVHILAPDGGAASIATIPLADFSANGAATVVHLFALWGLSQLLLALVYIVALLRYRSLVPLLYALAAVEYGVRLVLGFAKPIELAGTAPGGVANYAMVPLLLVLLWLSLRERGRAARRERLDAPDGGEGPAR